MKLVCLLAAMATLWVQPASAAEVVDLSFEYDLYANRHLLHGRNIGIAFNYSLPTPIKFTTGDTVRVRIDFSNGRTLGVNDLSFVAGNAVGSRAGNLQSIGNFVFGDPTGPLKAMTPMDTETRCCVWFGNIQMGDQVTSGIGPVTFSSMTWTSILLSDPSDFNIEHVSLSIFPMQIGGLFISGVPEPSTWGMMIVGVGFVGGALRTRRRKLSLAVNGQRSTRSSGTSFLKKHAFPAQ